MKKTDSVAPIRFKARCRIIRELIASRRYLYAAVRSNVLPFFFISSPLLFLFFISHRLYRGIRVTVKGREREKERSEIVEREGKGDKVRTKKRKERDGADETLYKLQGDERKEILELRSRCNINFTDNPFDNEHCDPVSKLIQSGTVSLTLNCQQRMRKKLRSG